MYNCDFPLAFCHTTQKWRPADGLFIEDEISMGLWEICKQQPYTSADYDRFEMMDNHFSYEV